MLSARGVTVGPLDDLDLDLGAGVTLVLGDHGCGTSTLLRVLAGQQVHDGTVEGGPCALLSQPPGDDWQDHDQAVGALGAPHLVGREMWTLSGGERQRVRLARALDDPAPVLLLDEPLGYLDDAGVTTVLSRLASRDDRAVLLVCKSDPRAVSVADRVLELVAGRLSERTSGVS